MYKLKKKGTEYMRQRIVEELNKIKGQDVKIYIDHKLFGKQQIKMSLKPETELGVGFRCKNQSIYINENEIIGYEINDNGVIINGELMCIRIEKLSR